MKETSHSALAGRRPEFWTCRWWVNALLLPVSFHNTIACACFCATDDHDGSQTPPHAPKRKYDPAPMDLPLEDRWSGSSQMVSMVPPTLLSALTLGWPAPGAVPNQAQPINNAGGGTLASSPIPSGQDRRRFRIHARRRDHRERGRARFDCGRERCGCARGRYRNDFRQLRARRSGFVQRRRWCRPQGRQLRRHAVESTVRQFARAAEWGSPRLRIHAGTAVRLGSPSAGARPGAAFPAADHTCRDTGQRIGDGRRATNSGDPERRGRPGSERRPATKFDRAASRVFHGNGQSVPDASILDSGIRIVRRQPRLLERRGFVGFLAGQRSGQWQRDDVANASERNKFGVQRFRHRIVVELERRQHDFGIQRRGGPFLEFQRHGPGDNVVGRNRAAIPVVTVSGESG